MKNPQRRAISCSSVQVMSWYASPGDGGDRPHSYRNTLVRPTGAASTDIRLPKCDVKLSRAEFNSFGPLVHESKYSGF